MSKLQAALAAIKSPRFLKFCAVGASGVVVNLGCLALLAEVMGMHPNLASAIAIELSIVSNFAINEAWTFRDRRASSSLLGRALRFHLVSAVGGVVQWSVFVLGNAGLFLALWPASQVNSYFGAPASGNLERYLLRPIAAPPDVGAPKFLSQLAGIGVATFWNFFANLLWTWRKA